MYFFFEHNACIFLCQESQHLNNYFVYEMSKQVNQFKRAKPQRTSKPRPLNETNRSVCPHTRNVSAQWEQKEKLDRENINFAPTCTYGCARTSCIVTIILKRDHSYTTWREGCYVTKNRNREDYDLFVLFSSIHTIILSR